MDDWSLLQQYARDGSRTALDELVQRHLGMVYAAAVREVGDAHLAEDVTQAVFLVLMRRASHLSPRVVLAGWLFKVTRHVAADARKGAARRAHHERKAAVAGAAMNSSEIESTWDHVRPLLNDALAALPQKYRDAIVLAYLEGKGHAAVAADQQVTENAARQRLFRGLSKLRSHFARKGVIVTEGALGATLGAASAGAVPATFMARICPALHSTTTGPALALAQNAIRSMIMFKIRAIAAALAVVALLTVLLHLALAQTAADHAVQPVAGAAPPATAPAGPAIDPAALSPTDVLIEAWRSLLANDVKRHLSYFTGLSPAQEAKQRQIVDLFRGMQELSDAIGAKFGEPTRKQILDAIGPDMNETILGRAKVTISDDRAIADVGSAGRGRMEIPLVKTADGWKITSIVDHVDDSMFLVTPRLRQLARDVTADRIATPQALQNAMRQLMQAPPSTTRP